MGKTGKDWRNPGKNKRKNDPSMYEDGYIPESDNNSTYTNNNERKTKNMARYNNNNRDNNRPEPHPVAKLLLDNFKDQIMAFVSAAPEEKAEAINDLFYVGDFPAAIEGAEGYVAFQLDRIARMNRDDNTTHGRLSTIVVVQNTETHMPAFMVSAFVTRDGDGNVRVMSYDEKGQNRRATLHWDTRDTENKDKE